uniref:Chemokine interleukin-8-like domain-containing protein n=1 Tax=Denticeps clupeoides TaxID=299321 RepID=A0A8C4AMG2_9TELE
MKTFCLIINNSVLKFVKSFSTASRPSECCMNFYQNRVPLRQIKSFTVTHPSCPKKGVVLTTLRGIKMCVNPDEQRIQDLMEKLTWGQKEGSGTGSQ